MAEEEKKKMGRPVGSVQDVRFYQMSLRVDETELEYFKTWNENVSEAIRALIAKANQKHRRDVLMGKA